MKHTTICILLFFGVCSSSTFAVDKGSRERTFLQALERFDSAKSSDDYRETAMILESILADGFENGAVYYNLGNAWFRAGQYGRAILNYRKAKPYRPRDPYLTANLEQALAAAPGKLGEPPRPWWLHVMFWTDWFSYPVKVHAFFVAAAIAAITSTIAVFLRRSRLHWIAAGLVLISAALAVDSFLNNPDFVNAHRAVMTGETIARKGMGSSYEPAFDQPLRDGAEFQVLNQTADWTFGHFEGIGDGWIRNEFVAR